MSFAARLSHLYKGLDRAHGRYMLEQSTDKNGKQKGKATTLRSPYTITHWEKHVDGKEGLGIIPITDNGTCWWGCIDIDKYPLDLEELEKKVVKEEFPFLLVRSKSGGCHLTVFFEEEQPCVEVVTKMQEAAAILGYTGSEIYPKQTKLANSQDVGNWLNMPYFDALSTDRFCVRNNTSLSLEEFLDYAESKKLRSVEEFVVHQKSEEFSDGPPCLQTLQRQGIGEGGRNTALFNIGVYLRLKHESNWEQHVDEANRTLINPPLGYREVASLVKSLEKKTYAFTCNTPPIMNFCNRDLCKRRQFGVTSFQHVDIGVVMDYVTKINSEPPMWILTIDGVRTEVETDDLLDQQRFRKICVNAINKIPGRMKPEEWDKFIRSKLVNIEIIDAPVEAKTSYKLVEFLRSFFETTPEGRTIDELSIGRWVKQHSHYVFRGADFYSYLDRQGVKLDARKIWQALNMNEVVFSQSLVRGVTIQTWHAPISTYGRVKSALAVPEIDHYENF